MKTLISVLLLVLSSISMSVFSEPLNKPVIPNVLQTSTFQSEVLPIEQAFALQLSVKKETLHLHWNIAKGYYLYQEKLKITTGQILKYDLPEGNKITDEFFGDQMVYFNDLSLSIPLPHALSEEFELIVTYQGCATAGFCYPPISEVWTVNKKTGEFEVKEEAHAAGSAELAELGALSHANAFTLVELMADTQQGWVWVIFYGLGLLLAFTPCLLPMFPILTSVIVGHHSPDKSWRAFSLSLSYVMGMAMTYSLAGIFAGLAGQTLQSYLQTPFFIGVCAVLLILLALNSFGWYQLQMPVRFRQAISHLQNRIQGGRFISAGLLGILSALIVSPCVTAPLIGALTYISTTSDTWLGGTSLFALALGMGTPLLIVGSLGGQFLPRSGEWLILTQRFFGILLIGVAIWMLERLLSAEIIDTLWGIAALLFAYYLFTSPVASKKWALFWKLCAGLILALSLFLFYQAIQPFFNNPVSELSEPKEEIQQHFISVTTWEQLEKEIKKSLKPVMVDVYAEWCVTCKIIEKHYFPDPKIASLLEKFTLIRIDITEQTADDKEIQKNLNIFAPPALLFFQPAGPEFKNRRLVGDFSVDTLAFELQRITQFQENNNPVL